MLNLELTADRTDDPCFVSFVTQLISGAIVTHQAPEVYIFKIDHWFDHKWLGFSGKFLGAVGSWRKRLTIPPFVANRIVDQRHYGFDEGGDNYQLLAGQGRRIHHRGRAGDNLYRSVKQIAPTSALFWYSGDTAATGRGSLMGYIPIEDDHWPWFLAFVRDDDWRISHRKDIHEYEVRLFQEAGKVAPSV